MDAVDGKPGLRERKKRRTHAAISDAAIALFLEHGFNQVSVAQVAEAAEVSKRTLFAYFPAKEDLVVHRLADHETEAARVVRSRPPGTAPLTALREHFLQGLRERDPITGLNDHPHIRSLTRMILDTPSLVARMAGFKAGAEHALAEALQETADTPELTARLAAVQIVAVQWALAQDNAARLAYGEPADERYAGALADAEHAFALLENGLRGSRRHDG
ncbi:helix-turn-helix domain-containing protein [Streptomyces sp. DSM 41699]|uniref:Helix-turn-helix domain-containing protein n=1 Tax=Streptomyces gibsoniae TaxID=3075529 RepID=A0ABU2U5M0_9ACTN|nr:helix-turn-helix domain-containing protein [Streptomyces sp. DSM 41699]MDT0468531.1 helix-turn-helix domain-containing protein [Streptomyces sp. DSM 41699]